MAEEPITQSNAISGSGRVLAIYAVIGILGVGVLVMLLAFLQGFTVENINQDAVDYETNSINLALSEEPPDLDSTKATDAVSGMLLGHVMEGLLRYDSNNDLVAGVAESWEVTSLSGCFKIREDARWSNGDPVTAHDFVFAWRKVVDPNNASEYAFIMYPIKNAEPITKSEIPKEELGVRALGDRELCVELERPTSYFLKLLAFPTFFPIQEKFFSETEGSYSEDADKLLYNGPFAMTHWAHDASVRLEKNEMYWNRDSIRLDAINFGYMIRDTNARVNLFEAGAIVTAGLDAEMLDKAMQKGWWIEQHLDGVVFFIDFNHRPERATANWNLRRAIQLVNDPEELVNKVIKVPGNLPTTSIFPSWVRGVEGYFRDEHPAPPHRPDAELARQHLELAKQELGIEGELSLTLLTGDNPSSNKQAEYFQNLLQKHLGINIRIDRQIFKQRLAKMTSGEFDMVMAGWGPDYDDGLTFGDLYASWNENNRGRYKSDYVDEQIRLAQNSIDPIVRTEAFARIQQRLWDDVALLPSYERGNLFVEDDRVHGIVRRVVGADPDYSNAWIQ